MSTSLKPIRGCKPEFGRMTEASGLAVDLIAALSLGTFMAAVLLWGCVVAERL